MIQFLRALFLRTCDLLVSFGAPPYAYDPAGDFTTRDIYPRTYSLRKAIALAERFAVAPRTGKFKKRHKHTYQHVFINNDLYTISYTGRRPYYPDDIVDRLFK
jgi:hypothetical protein